MTDLLNSLSNSGMTNTYGAVYTDIAERIKKIDETLNVAEDVEAAGKQATRQKLITEQKPEIDKNFEQFTKAISNYDDRQLAGFYFGLMDALSKQFEEKLEKFVSELTVSEPPPDIKVLSEGDIKTLTEQRLGLFKNAKMLRELAISMGAKADDLPPVKKRQPVGGVQGKKREISTITWSINGKELPQENQKLTWVVEKYKYSNIVDFRELLAKHLGKDNLRGLPNEIPPFTLNLLEGQTTPDILTGRKLEPVGEAIEEDASPDDDDDDENENGPVNQVV